MGSGTGGGGGLGVRLGNFEGWKPQKVRSVDCVPSESHFEPRSPRYGPLLGWGCLQAGEGALDIGAPDPHQTLANTQIIPIVLPTGAGHPSTSAH